MNEPRSGFVTRRVRIGIAALATAAGIVLIVRLVLPGWPAIPGHSPEFEALIAAVVTEANRPIEGRLHGFPYAPVSSGSRGTAHDASPAVRSAAAHVEQAARTHDTAAMQATVGVAYLVSGNRDKAIDTLEYASSLDPARTSVLNDLAVAYLARAQEDNRAEDWPRALAAAERAIERQASDAAPYFNRALALEGLHLDDAAMRAWQELQARESQAGWADEAAGRERRLRERLTQPASATRPDNQVARERVEDELLPRWAAAFTADDEAEADRALDEADTASRAIAEQGGDQMARDAVQQIRTALARTDREALAQLAAGHAAFARARSYFLNDRLADASAEMARAASAFTRANSPYARWGDVYASIAFRTQGEIDAALAAVARATSQVIPRGYGHLQGRLAWSEAIALEATGRFDVARERLLLAVGLFKAANEVENLTACLTYLAEAFWFLGDQAGAWQYELEALPYLRVLRPGIRRNTVLFYGAYFSLSSDMPRVSLHFQNALVESAVSTLRGPAVASAYRQRSRIQALVGDLSHALADLEQAEAAIAQIEDRALHERHLAEIEAVRGEVLIESDAARATDAATAAIDYFRRVQHHDRVSELLGVRGRGRQARGDTTGARADFEEAVVSFERARRPIASVVDRLNAFEKLRGAFGNLVRLEILEGGDPDRVLKAVEQERAAGFLHATTGADDPIADPGLVRSRLPPDVAVLYFASLKDRLAIWVLTRQQTQYFTRPVNSDLLSVYAVRLQRLIAQGAGVNDIRVAAAPFLRDVLHPILERAEPARHLVFISDGTLETIPFAALPDTRGQPLVHDYTISLAPSLRDWMRSSQQLAGFAARSVLAVGDGHDVALSGLPRLRFADEEATRVGQLYPTATVLAGPRAIKAAFMRGGHDVIHFAGHTVINRRFPLLSRMLLAPAPDGGDNGTLLGADLVARHLLKTSVIVLATCDSAAGRVLQGEGVISMARLFLETGVPSVIASLWPVEDATSIDIMLEFHRQLRMSNDPSAALRASQVLFVDQRGPNTPIRDWGGFVSLGGIPSLQPERIK